jgi:hypothetical protein
VVPVRSKQCRLAEQHVNSFIAQRFHISPLCREWFIQHVTEKQPNNKSLMKKN